MQLSDVLKIESEGDLFFSAERMRNVPFKQYCRFKSRPLEGAITNVFMVPAKQLLMSRS